MVIRLKKIATKYKTTYEAIAATNKIAAPYTIYPKQELKIAIIKTPTQVKTYTVKKRRHIKRYCLQTQNDVH